MAISPLSNEAISEQWGDTTRFTPEQVRSQGEAVFRAFGLNEDDAAIAKIGVAPRPGRFPLQCTAAGGVELPKGTGVL